jgi:hypothetical protein
MMVIAAIVRLYLYVRQWHVELDFHVRITRTPPKK